MDDKLVLEEISTLFRRADRSGSKGDLERSADCAIHHMDRMWPSNEWAEICLLIGCSCATELWATHRDAPAAYQRLQPLAQRILTLGWIYGGASGYFHPRDANEVLTAVKQCEVVLETRSHSVEPDTPRRTDGSSCD